MSSPAPLPKEIHRSAQRGELQKMVRWLRKGGLIDALCPTALGGRTTLETLLHAAVVNSQLEMVRELLMRGASIDLPNSLGSTALMAAAHRGNLSTVLVLLQHSANPDLQNNIGITVLMWAVGSGHEACVQALLRAKADTELLDKDGYTVLQRAEAKGHTAIADLIRQHAAPSQPAAAPPAAPPDAGEPAVSAPTSLPLELYDSAARGELQKVAKWVRKGGLVDALCSLPDVVGQPAAAYGLLHAAVVHSQLEMVRELLKRGASIDLPGSDGFTALMYAAGQGHLSTVLVLLQHSANPDLQDIRGITALMQAADYGHEACVQALLRAKANTELIDNDGSTSLQYAEIAGHTAITELIRQHAAPPPPAAAAPPAASPDAGEPAVSSPASLPDEILESAERGKLHEVVKWLRKGGPVDALYSATARATRGLGQQPQIDLLDRYNIPSLDR